MDSKREQLRHPCSAATYLTIDFEHKIWMFKPKRMARGIATNNAFAATMTFFLKTSAHTTTTLGADGAIHKHKWTPK